MENNELFLTLSYYFATVPSKCVCFINSKEAGDRSLLTFALRLIFPFLQFFCLSPNLTPLIPRCTTQLSFSSPHIRIGSPFLLS